MIIDTTITLVTGIIGSLPIPGAGLIADAYGLVLGWITGIGQEDPWKKLEDSLKQYVDEAVLGLELNTLKNDIADIERRFDSFCKGRTASNWKPGDTLSRELETRLISCYEGVQRIQQFLYNPNSNKHTTLPYFERCSTLYFAVMSSVTQRLKSYNIQTEYETFFNQTYAYLDGVYASSGAYKSSKIKYKWGGFFNHLNYVIDEGKTDLTGGLRWIIRLRCFLNDTIICKRKYLITLNANWVYTECLLHTTL
jgi:hypothetical protein